MLIYLFCVFRFPEEKEGKKMRKFQQKWLSNFPWLAYSEVVGGGLCKYCAIFAPEMVGNNSAAVAGLLVKKPLTKFKDAIE